MKKATSLALLLALLLTVLCSCSQPPAPSSAPAASTEMETVNSRIAELEAQVESLQAQVPEAGIKNAEVPLTGTPYIALAGLHLGEKEVMVFNSLLAATADMERPDSISIVGVQNFSNTSCDIEIALKNTVDEEVLISGVLHFVPAGNYPANFLEEIPDMEVLEDLSVNTSLLNSALWEYWG